MAALGNTRADESQAEVTSIRTAANASASLSAGLPRPFFLEHALPPVNLATFWIILPYALTLAAVGLIESLMTLSLIDEITSTRGSGNRECMGQGVANIVCGLFGGMSGCAMIGQSLINVNSGGRAGRLLWVKGLSAPCQARIASTCRISR